MKDLILNVLKEAKVETDGLSDDDLFTAYNEHLAAAAAQDESSEEENTTSNSGDAIVVAVQEALKPLADKIATFETTLNATAVNEKMALVGGIVATKLYPHFTADDLNALSIDRLKELQAKTGAGYGLPPIASGNIDGDYQNLEMPA